MLILFDELNLLSFVDRYHQILQKVFIVIAIAANSDEHMNVLASLGDSLESEEDAKNLWKTNSVDKIYDILS